MDEIQKLKSEAYDMISIIEQAQLKLKQLNQKILELSQKVGEKDETKPT